MLSRLSELIEQFTGADGAHETSIPELVLYRQSAPSEVIPCWYEPALCVIAQGSKRVELGTERYQYDPAQFLLVAADLPMMAQVVEASAARPYLALRLALDPALVAEVAAEVNRSEVSSAPPARALSVSPLDPTLLDAATRLVGLLESPRDRAVLAPLVLREISYRLLVGQQGARLRQVVTADGHAERVVSALGWLKTHFAEPLRVDDLARRARMSTSAFHQHFKSLTSLSPLQYQKRLRLQEARRLMLAAGLDAAEASFRVGYESPSQFSREYRRLFGSPPRRDVTALRVDNVAAPDANAVQLER